MCLSKLVNSPLYVDLNPVLVDSVKEHAKRFKMAGSIWLIAVTTALLNLWEDIIVQWQLDSARRKRGQFAATAAGPSYSAASYVHRCIHLLRNFNTLEHTRVPCGGAYVASPSLNSVAADLRQTSKASTPATITLGS